MISRIVLILCLVAALAACGGNGNTHVVASFYPLAFAVRQIAGPSMSVDDLTPPGAEPHDLELTARQVGQIQQARVVFYLGHGFQPAVERAAGAGGVDLLQGLPLRPGDPHAWLDPSLYARMGERIARALHRSPHPFLLGLRRLDAQFHAGLAHCQRREIVTSHAAFGYLGRRYGLVQVAITGITPEAEPTPGQLARVVRIVRRTRATTVFTEPLISPRVGQTVARDTGARTAILDPIESGNGGDYFTRMRRNLVALRKALGCR